MKYSHVADSRARLSVVGIIVCSLFVALFARLVYLQVIDSAQLASAAKANQIRTVYEQAPRGRILDRKGRVLAGNRETDVITVERDAVRADPTLLGRLATFLGTDSATLAQKMNDPKASPYRAAVVASGLDPAVVASFRERQSEFSGAAAETQVQRFYPDGTLAAHALGYVGEVNDQELVAHKQQAYRLGDTIGKSGIESAYESTLRGKPGIDKIEVDASSRPVRVLQHTPPIAGDDVQLTIDEDVQKAAEDGLARGLQTARGQTTDAGGSSGMPANAGSAVAVNPQDGSILAMASYPTFDPGSFAKGIPYDQYNRLTDPNGDLPLTNRAIQGTYAPGSTFKLMTSVASLRTNVINANTVIDDGGVFTLGASQFRNAQGHAYGPVNISKAITVSSDVFFYNLGDRVWNARRTVGDPIQSAARDFGFGVKSGLPISGEADGRVPDPVSRKKAHDQNPAAYPEGNWYAGDNVNLAIGQGDTLVTPLQLSNAYATFANGGTLYRSRLVLGVIGADGKARDRTAPEVVHKVDLPPGVRDPIEQGLSGAVQDPRGTAYSAFAWFDLKAFPAAGKTGTAQVSGKQDTALFAAYGPVGNPQVSVSVVLEQSGFGGQAAAPVARRILASVAGQPVEPIRLGSSAD